MFFPLPILEQDDDEYVDFDIKDVQKVLVKKARKKKFEEVILLVQKKAVGDFVPDVASSMLYHPSGLSQTWIQQQGGSLDDIVEHGEDKYYVIHLPVSAIPS